MIKQLLLTSALFGLAICSTNALADQVLCDVSPTSTPQEMAPDFCGSQSVTSSRPYVSFQFEPSKPTRACDLAIQHTIIWKMGL